MSTFGNAEHDAEDFAENELNKRSQQQGQGQGQGGFADPGNSDPSFDPRQGGYGQQGYGDTPQGDPGQGQGGQQGYGDTPLGDPGQGQGGSDPTQYGTNQDQGQAGGYDIEQQGGYDPNQSGGDQGQ